MAKPCSSIASTTRNPFGVQDVPDPNGQDVMAFAAATRLNGSADDANARAWPSSNSYRQYASIEGDDWASRWNGGIAKDKWKQGKAELRMTRDRVYLLFHWDNDTEKGLLDARREGSNGLIGRYLNLGNPDITRPWVGLIVDNQRIDGRWTDGRLDFRR